MKTSSITQPDFAGSRKFSFCPDENFRLDSV